MKSAPLKLMALIFLAMLLLPLASSEDARSMEKYLDCLTDKKVDIVFVFDTTNSMGGEINELSAVVKDFATDLGASRIDYRLGLVEFRDFPITCGERTKISCGSPGDLAYKVKDNGTLTAEVNTFGSWLRELKAGGGGTGGPEAVLAALRHAGSDLLWRSDAEKVIIVLTDAGPHPDGDCCNAEGDTLEGTIFGLTGQGARVHVIGSEDAALRRIAGDTGGQFFKIRSGLSLKPLLKEITGAMSCSFKVEAETSCLNRTLETKVRLVGKEVIPFVAGQTESWMYLDQAGSKSRYNLSYDQSAGAYLASVSEVCGPVELAVYGRVGERSAVQTVQVECGTCGDAVAEQGMLSISGRVFDDSNGDGMRGTDEAGLEGWDVLLTKPDGSSTAAKTDRKGYYIFTGLSPGSYKVEAAAPFLSGWLARLGHGVEATARENWTATASAEGARMVELADIHESEIDLGFRKVLANKPPEISDLVADPECPQVKGSVINWTATAADPEDDPILFRFLLNNETVTDWTAENTWTWGALEAGSYQIEVQVRDGKHAGPDGTDDRESEGFEILIAELKPSSSDINSVAFSPDGRILASGREDGTIELLDTDNGNEIRTWDGHYSAVSVVAFSSDGSILASGSGDGTIKLWDVPNGNEIQVLKHSENVDNPSFEPVSGIALSPDDHTLASFTYEGIVKIWDITTGEEIRTLGDEYHNSTTSIALSPDGRTLATGGYDTIKLWDTASWTEIWTGTVEGHSGPVDSVAFSPDGQILASGSYENTTSLWDTASGTEINTLDYSSVLTPKGSIFSTTYVTFSPDGRALALIVNDQVVLWDISNGTDIRIPQKSHHLHLNTIAFSPDGRTLATGGDNNVIELWDVVSDTPIRTLSHEGSSSYSVTFSPDGGTLISFEEWDLIRYWNVSSGRAIRILEVPVADAFISCLSPDGSTMASINSEDDSDGNISSSTIALWDAANGTEIRTLKSYSYIGVESVSFSPDGRILATIRSDGIVELLDTSSGIETWRLEGQSDLWNSIAFSPDGKTLATGGGHSVIITNSTFDKYLDLSSSNSTIKLWNIDSRTEIWTAEGHSGEISTVAFSPDGYTLASGSDDGTIKLWNTSNGTEIRTLAGPSDSEGRHVVGSIGSGRSHQWITEPSYYHNMNGVIWIAFSPDGGTVLTKDDERETLWDTASGKEISPFCFSGVYAAAFSPDGRTLATTYSDAIRIWEAK